MRVCGDCDILVFSAGPLPNLYQDRLESLGETVEVLKDVIPRIKHLGLMGLLFLSQILQMWWPLTYVNI